MHRNDGYHSSSYSMDEYLERLDRIQRMPSMMGEYPSFPSVHEVLNNKPTNTEARKNHQHTPDVQKKSLFAEHGKKKTEVGKHNEEEMSIDTEADGFIQQKHKVFALCKWDTYKVY